MAVNLCCQHFGTTVTSSSVSIDGYDVENLLGGKTVWGQPKGFLAESFIKPPVEITFAFPFNISIQKIVIDPKVGSQISTGIEIFTASVPMNGHHKGGMCSSASKETKHLRKSDGCKGTNLRSQSQMNSERNTAVFASVGKAFPQDRNASLFNFINLSYRAVYPQIGNVEISADTADAVPGVATRTLRNSQFGALTSASHVTVRVGRIISGSVAVKSVQIWGQPSQICSKTIVDWFLQVVEFIRKDKEEKAERKSNTTTKRSTAGASVPSDTLSKFKSSQSMPECPEEFLDPITNEMLILPVLLPSGHTIDSETLRKHSEAEAQWGRPPSDPFTGIPFSKTRKPLPNVKLKERLDNFLLKGGENVLNPPARDVGRPKSSASSQAVPVVASLLGSIVQNESVIGKSKKQNQQESNLSKIHRDGQNLDRPLDTTQATLRSGKGTKRKRPASNTDHKRSRKQRSEVAQIHKISEGCVNQDAIDNAVTSSASTRGSCHEDVLAQSLDNALEDALSTLPSFSGQTLQQSNKPSGPGGIDSWSCSVCSNVLAKREVYQVTGPLNIYTLPCAHLICRDCLLARDGKSHKKCIICNRTFEPSDVVKVHV